MNFNDRVIIGLGSNTGDSVSILSGACEHLKRLLEQFRMSSWFETEPLEIYNQPYFINGAVSGFFGDSPAVLLEKLHRIERTFGRDRSQEKRWAERTLDLDILLFGDRCISDIDLEIPHPRLKVRAFALIPLLELEPEAREPLTGIPYRTMLDSLENQKVRKLYDSLC
ncbi:MAG: 2-amino-4-hydroxy-6-hydroxymethyldihydropteridine diphosphokinase [Treponema sp.]|jgi:2-amino-4-hydroxy-6-hydroxymethyldihydropteridine diphosphokinase|nr:2-amino-4-hydroxy-6-hydroxymethyldihydropteridine diphosphokinase [Treponema sp.]